MSVAERDVQMWKEAFGGVVRRTRDAQGLTLRELARRCGLTENFIGAVEIGRREPSLSTMLALSKGLGVGISELLGARGLSPGGLTIAINFEKLDATQRAAVLRLARAVGRSDGRARSKTPSKKPAKLKK